MTTVTDLKTMLNDEMKQRAKDKARALKENNPMLTYWTDGYIAGLFYAYDKAKELEADAE